ncbi:MAG TPA: hypothetical protein VLF91_02030 [Candidatus Saccharimonadales bacterium]|nr:hypothetical protein [Candidatus Saccharimonadales bacterium]
MIGLLAGLFLVLFGLFVFALQRFYSSVPARELKRLAAHGDHLAEALYRPVAYGESLRLLLWAVSGASLTAGFVTISDSLVEWLAFMVIALSLAGAVFIQSLRLTVRSARLAVTVTPALAWLLDHAHLPFDAAAKAINRLRTHAAHSGLYETEDLLALLEQQKGQADNRIHPRQLETLIRAAQFDQRQAADIAVPMSKLKLVSMDDHIGPVLLGELHDSKQNTFLVYQERADNIVGTLLLRDAVSAREGGRVADLLRPHLSFVHEDFNLRQVLNAFVRTGQSLIVVINSFEEAVGVIDLQRLLTELIGEAAQEDDFTVYDDRAAVAAFRLQPEPVLQEVTEDLPEDSGEPEAEPDAGSSPEPTEVVE